MRRPGNDDGQLEDEELMPPGFPSGRLDGCWLLVLVLLLVGLYERFMA